jgi:protoporphyrinogen oxidase
MKVNNKKMVLIVGAGLTGLTAGTLLAEAGRPCLIVERESEPGGLCRSFTLDGIVFDLGPHVFFIDPETPPGRFAASVLATLPTIRRPFAFAIQAGGRLWKFPNHFDFLRYPWKYKKEVLASLLKKRPPLPPGPISAAFELSEKSGQSLYELLFKDLFLKKTLLPTNALHHHWLARVDRTVDNELEPYCPGSRAAILTRVMRKLREKYFYPEKGLQAFTDAIRDRFLAAGGELRLGASVSAFERQGGRITAATIDGETLPVKNVVWTAPLNALNATLGANLPKLPSVSMLLIYLTYARTRRAKRPYVYTYHPDPALIFNRIYYPESIFREACPPDREGLCLEFNVSDDLKTLSHEEIIARCIADVETLGLYPASALRETRVVELPESMPVYGLDYEERMRSSYAAVREIENLHAVGRQGGFYFCLTPGAMSQGIKMASRLLGTESGE